MAVTRNQTFSLDDVETSRENDFINEHKNCVSSSAMGEKIEYRFIPGSVGTVVILRCLICGKEKNITNFSNW